MAVMSVVFGVTALLIINTTFMMYDDEGYVVLTYQKFIQGERLYDDIFSQYGPVPYLYNQCVSLLLNSPFSHTLGRGLTAFHWTLASVLSCAVTVSLARSRFAGLIAGFTTFGMLWQLNAEPSHPGGFICFILSIAVFVACCLNQTHHWHALAATLGIAASLLLLTKINIGVFFIAGVGAALLLLTQWPPRWRVPALCAATGLAALPWVLMRSRLDDPNVLMLAVQFSLATLALLWLFSADSKDSSIPFRSWTTGLAAFVGTICLICVVMTIRGTNPASLIDGVLLNPLKHPAHFNIPMRWPGWIWPVSIVTLTLSLIAGVQMRRQGTISPLVRIIVSLLRICVAAVFIWKVEHWASLSGVGMFASHGLALLPLFLIPLEGSKISSVLVLASLVACAQILHVYPVAGSQKGWGTFLMIPVFVTGLHAISNTQAFGIRPPRWMLALFLLATCVPTFLLLRTGWQRYGDCRPLGLSGAEHLHVTDPTRLLIRIFTLNAGVHADMLFSRPGMFSYNIWSGVPTPTSKNATHWFWLLTDAEEQAIIAKLDATPRSALISSRFLEEFLKQIGVPIKGPLHDYLLASYKPLFEISGFNFWVPHASDAVPFGLIETFVSSSSQSAAPPVILQSHIVLDGHPATVRLQLIKHPWSVVHDYTQTARQITLEPVTAQGTVLGAPMPLASAGNLRGLYRLRVYLDAQPDPSALRSVVLTVLDPKAGILSESIFN